MKLQQLEIGGFGRLSDLAIDFAPGITVICGANESGKSTVQRVIRALLFGLDAGSQGRAVDRSDWQRWQPWSAGRYGAALEYQLDNGSRFRVAARYDHRDHVVSVRELGGGDVTAAMRRGRRVAPGVIALGVSDEVFCATAWVGDDGLRLTAGEPSNHASRIREALERVADSGDVVTAAAALVHLREAIARVGSERKSNSPLGVATARLRQLDAAIAHQRSRAAAIVGEEDTLRRLDEEASAASARSRECEARWLQGRLASLRTQRDEISRSVVELAELQATAAETADAADVPLVDEDRVVSGGGALRQAILAAQEAWATWDAAAIEVAALDRRREEISRGLEALHVPSTLPDDAGVTVGVLKGRLASEQATLDELADPAEDSRSASLRGEIAATGLSGVPLGSAPELTRLLETVMRARFGGRAGRALMVMVVTSILGGLAVSATHLNAGIVIAFATAAIALIAVLAWGSWRTSAEGRAARRAVARRAPELASDAWEMHRALERLPILAALHDEVARHDAAAEHRMEANAAVRRRLSSIARESAELAALCGIAAPASSDPNASAAELLDAIDETVAAQMRTEELRREFEDCNRRATELERLRQAAERASMTVDQVEADLRRMLDRAGIPADIPPALAVAAYGQRCARRRQHDAATARVEVLRRRLAQLGDGEQADGLLATFSDELRTRGLATDHQTEPLNAGQLAQLEREVEYARQAAMVSATRAATLRARLAGIAESGSPLADLEDERQACVVARDRATHQLAALEHAVAVIEATTRDVHRTLAPRLAKSIGERLDLLTDGRYTRVDVDAEHLEVFLQSDERPDLVPLHLLSHGTRDQVALLLRLALAEALSGSSETVPVLLDEPLLTADPERRERAVAFLTSLSLTHQLVVTTSDPATAVALAGSAGAVVELGSPTLVVSGMPVSSTRPLLRR